MRAPALFRLPERRESLMCFGIPGRVVEISDPDAYLAKADVNGIKRAISVRLLADSGIEIGDWVLVHVGFALAKIDEREASATLDAVKRMGKGYTDELDAFRSTGVS
jgi:hydrogenase expression/formation protein HypC